MGLGATMMVLTFRCTQLRRSVTGLVLRHNDAAPIDSKTDRYRFISPDEGRLMARTDVKGIDHAICFTIIGRTVG
jgi:hypothetical protein